jgi:hypothetical protein
MQTHRQTDGIEERLRGRKKGTESKIEVEREE